MSTSVAQDPAPSGHAHYVWVAFISTLTIALLSQSMPPLLTDIVSALKVPATQWGLAGTAYASSSALSALICASWLDRCRLRSVIILGIVVHGIGLGLSVFASTWPMFVAGQFLCGLAAGTLIPATASQVVRTVTLEQRASALGRVKSAWALCALVGVPLIAFLSSHIGWRSVLTLLFAGWMICLAMLHAPHAFSTVETRPSIADPTAQEESSNRKKLNLPSLLVVNFLFFLGSYGALAFLGVAVRKALALDASGAGWFMGIYGIGFLFGASRGKWITYLGPERAMVIAQLGLAALTAFLGVLISSFALSALAAALWGVFQAFGFTASVVCASTIGSGKSGRNLALNQFSISVGGGLGTSLMGLLLARNGYGTVGLTAATAIATAGILCLFMSRRCP